MKALFLFLLIVPLLSSTSLSMDPPAKLWEKWYYPGLDFVHFRDIELTPSGDLFITGSIRCYTYPDYDRVALLIDQEGEIIWEVPHEFASASGRDGAVLPDGSFVLTGDATLNTNPTFRALFIHKLSPSGETEWTRIYDYPLTHEAGYSITCLPDGGFAVCGRVHGTGHHYAGQLWLLRTDENGDTLWTREWGITADWGETVLFENNELCLLARGRTDSLPTSGPHLLFYDLDGNYIGGTDYPELNYQYPADMCSASDGGYTFVTGANCVIWHTDRYGEPLWWHDIHATPGDRHEGFCVRRTMDGGYVFSGWYGYFEGPWDDGGSESNALATKKGWLVRLDAYGNELWNLKNNTGHDNFFYSCVQLPAGGYVAVGTWGGGAGYLVRYAPETGIEGGEVIQGITLDAVPNPFRGSLSVSFDLSEPGHVNLDVYDFSGRLVHRLLSDEVLSGRHSAVWSPGTSVPSGCYLLRLVCGEETVVRRCVLLR